MLLYVLVMFWYPKESFGMFKTFLAVLVARFNDLATYSRKSSSNRGIRIKRVPKKDVIPIEEPEDSYRCGEGSEIRDKSADKAVEKGKQAKVVIAHADPYEIFRMSTYD